MFDEIHGFVAELPKDITVKIAGKMAIIEVSQILAETMKIYRGLDLKDQDALMTRVLQWAIVASLSEKGKLRIVINHEQSQEIEKEVRALIEKKVQTLIDKENEKIK